MCTHFSSVNPWAVLVSALAYFFIGALWYSPVLFSKIWMVESKVVPDPSKSLPRLLVITFLLTLFMILILACFIEAAGIRSLQEGIIAGALAGLGFVATTIGITFLYEGRSLKLFLIDTGYHLTGLLVAGAILGAWK